MQYFAFIKNRKIDVAGNMLHLGLVYTQCNYETIFKNIQLQNYSFKSQKIWQDLAVLILLGHLMVAVVPFVSATKFTDKLRKCTQA